MEKQRLQKALFDQRCRMVTTVDQQLTATNNTNDAQYVPSYRNPILTIRRSSPASFFSRIRNQASDIAKTDTESTDAQAIEFCRQQSSPAMRNLLPHWLRWLAPTPPALATSLVTSPLEVRICAALTTLSRPGNSWEITPIRQHVWGRLSSRISTRSSVYGLTCVPPHLRRGSRVAANPDRGLQSPEGQRSLCRRVDGRFNLAKQRLELLLVFLKPFSVTTSLSRPGAPSSHPSRGIVQGCLPQMMQLRGGGLEYGKFASPSPTPLYPGWSRSVPLFTYLSLIALFYWVIKSLSYWQVKHMPGYTAVVSVPPILDFEIVGRPSLSVFTLIHCTGSRKRGVEGVDCSGLGDSGLISGVTGFYCTLSFRSQKREECLQSRLFLRKLFNSNLPSRLYLSQQMRDNEWEHHSKTRHGCIEVPTDRIEHYALCSVEAVMQEVHYCQIVLSSGGYTFNCLIFIEGTQMHQFGDIL
ncbi:hypothetical protein T12_2687 [Trichinella patagoniensis]|uniref:Uncharacterized protein n=1 Tax=Trichinella patagoniensis TaxID=990121 RepID=A0A0V0Z621_9BILA|nr:hypothetical protein T12_2687 [Trichinella patagoniensis]